MSNCRPSLHWFSPASSVLRRLRQRCPFFSTRSEAGPVGQGQRLPTFTVLPSSSGRRRRLGQFATATRPRTSRHVLVLEGTEAIGRPARSRCRSVLHRYGCTSPRSQPLAEGRLVPIIAGSYASPYPDSTSARHPAVRLGGSGLVRRASDGWVLGPSACLLRFILL
jgi:hypothetical protein